MPKEILLSKNNEEKDDRTTHGIKHLGLSDYLNILPHIKFSVSGQKSSTQSPTFHTVSRSMPFLTTSPT